MVTIQSRIIRKKYKRSSPPYIYRQLLLALPSRHNKVLEPFLKKKLDFAKEVKDGHINISLAELKDRA